MGEKQIVVLNSGWASKINWAQLIGFAATLATALGYTVPPDLIPSVVAGITAVSSVITIVLRTWFTGQPVGG